MPVKRMSEFLLPALAAAGLLLAAGPAVAQGKIAVINTQKIVFESETGKASLAAIRTLQEEKEAELKAQQQEAEDLGKRISDGRLSLSEEKLAEMQGELEVKTRNLRRSQEDAAAELERRQTTVLAEIEKKVMPVINQIGQEQGYTMIFRKFESGLIYVDDAVDITDQVIQRLDTGSAGAGGG